MPRAGELSSADPGSLGAARYPLEGRHVCPFCGSTNETMEGPCPQCTMTNTPETRKATKSRIGPWYVLQSRNPAAPGMKYETLLGFVRKGRVKARSIVRGPTTHQLWRFACQVKGLSREFGTCYSCGGSIERDAQLCPQCNRLQDPPADPDVFLEGQGTAGQLPEVAAPQPAARGAMPAEAFGDVRQGPIFKELKLPPLGEFSTLSADAVAPVAPPVAATPAPAAPAPKTNVTEVAAPAVAARMPTPPPVAVPRVEAPPGPAGGAPKRNANDVFLSAKDLAAAFQLGFDGDNRGGKGSPDAELDAVFGASAAAPAHPHRSHYRRPRRKRRVLRNIFLLLLLGIAGAAAWLVIDAGSRQRVFAWAEAKYMDLTGANLYPDLSRSPSGGGAGTGGAATYPYASDPADDASPAGAAVTPAVRANSSPRVNTLPVRATTEPAAPAAARVTEPPPTTPAPTAAPPVEPASRPSVVVSPGPAVPTPAPLPSRAPVATKPAATQPAVPARISIEDARRKSKELWEGALKAEDAGDFRKAKSLYEQMMKLPREVWYQGVEQNLRFAKDALGEK